MRVAAQTEPAPPARSNFAGHVGWSASEITSTGLLLSNSAPISEDDLEGPKVPEEALMETFSFRENHCGKEWKTGIGNLRKHGRRSLVTSIFNLKQPVPSSFQSCFGMNLE